MIIKEWNSNDIFCLDLSISTQYKEKKQIIDLIISRGARVSFILNKTVKYLIRNDNTNIDTYKCKLAFKLNIPILDVNYLFDKCSVNLEKYLIVNKEHEEKFKNGLIALKGSNKS